ncbi:hypothetical protein ACP4OV_002020 [Aristida adscensionis]
MANFALAAFQPLVGLIHSEAQLLRGIRSDVQFINDEMESIKAFLQKLSGTKEGTGDDHLTRAWMAQVMELAYISTNCIQDYAHCRPQRPHDKRGFVGFLKRVARLPKCMLARRRIAIRIRKLKIRVLEVNQRQQRYVFPTEDTGGSQVVNQKLQAGWVGGHNPEWLTHPDTDRRRQEMLKDADILTEGTKEVIQWLKEEQGTDERKWLRVIAIVSPDGNDGAATELADKVYENMSSGTKLPFDIIKRVSIKRPAPDGFMRDVRRQLLSEDAFKWIRKDTCLKLPPPFNNFMLDMRHRLFPEYSFEWIGMETRLKLPPPVKGKKLLVVLSGLEYPEEWDNIKVDLDSFGCSPGSAIVLTTKNDKVAKRCCPSRTRVHSLVDFHLRKAVFLAAKTYNVSDNAHRQDSMKKILNICYPDVHCMNLFLQALYTNPDRTGQELEELYTSIEPHESSKIKIINQLKRFCYHGLPACYKNCLWYSAIFTHKIYKTRSASLKRCWVAEGLLSKGEEAQRCFDVLCNQKLLLPLDIDCTGKVKSCAVDPLVMAMLKEITAGENFLDANQLPPALALNFSVRSGVKLRQLSNKTASNSLLKFLKSLTSSSSFRLLRVLDLEGYKGFTKCHLKNICKIHQLRYLILRNTDVAYLPKEINQLQYLETLDIRGTMVQKFNAVLPNLKQLFAGYIVGTSQDTMKSKACSSAVYMPCGVAEMKLEVLSHVKVSNSIKELINVDKEEKHLDLG